jgi:hypothetical protein
VPRWDETGPGSRPGRPSVRQARQAARPGDPAVLGRRDPAGLPQAPSVDRLAVPFAAGRPADPGVRGSSERARGWAEARPAGPEGSSAGVARAGVSVRAAHRQGGAAPRRTTRVGRASCGPSRARRSERSARPIQRGRHDRLHPERRTIRGPSASPPLRRSARVRRARIHRCRAPRAACRGRRCPRRPQQATGAGRTQGRALPGSRGGYAFRWSRRRPAARPLRLAEGAQTRSRALARPVRGPVHPFSVLNAIPAKRFASQVMIRTLESGRQPGVGCAELPAPGWDGGAAAGPASVQPLAVHRAELELCLPGAQPQA